MDVLDKERGGPEMRRDWVSFVHRRDTIGFDGECRTSVVSRDMQYYIQRVLDQAGWEEESRNASKNGEKGNVSLLT